MSEIYSEEIVLAMEDNDYILDRKCVVGSDTVPGSVVKWSWSTWFVPGLIHYLTTNPVLTDNVPIMVQYDQKVVPI